MFQLFWDHYNTGAKKALAVQHFYPEPRVRIKGSLEGVLYGDLRRLDYYPKPYLEVYGISYPGLLMRHLHAKLINLKP